MRRRFLARFAVALAVTGLGSLGLAACTHSDPAPAPDTTVTQTQTETASPTAIPTTPVAAGPTTSATKDCPLLPLATVMPIIGQRLDHTTVQTSGGKTVGCDYFPITVGLASSENLPTNGYPSARITLTTYPSAESARQVLAIVARAGVSPSEQDIGTLVGETFQTTFYPPDHGQDWACVFIKGPLLVTVLVAEPTTQGQQNAVGLAQALAPHV